MAVGFENTQVGYKKLSSVFLLAFWREKWLVLLALFLCLAAANTYIWLKSPTYEAKAYIVPATLNDYADFNYKRNILLDPLKADTVASILSRELFSQENRRLFFQKVYLPSLSVEERNTKNEEQLYKKFNTVLLVREDPRYVPANYTVAARGNNQKLALAYAAGFLNLVQEKAEKNLIRRFSNESKAKADILAQKIAFLKNAAEIKRSMRLEKLNAALKIASQLNIVKPQFGKGPLYTLGTEALKAEIAVINENKSIDAFIPATKFSQSFPLLVSQYEILKNVRISGVDIHVFRIDGGISASSSPVSPNKSLILAFAALFGLLLGGLLALNRFYRENRDLTDTDLEWSNPKEARV